MRRILSVMPVLLLVISAVVLFSSRNNSTTHSQIRSAAITAHNYRYYILKGPGGFVLARAARGPHGEPAETPQPLAPLGNGFGQYETDSVGSIQLSPDGQYLAIDGVREGGEQVWIYDTQRMMVSLQPPAVMGNFLHWLPGSHSFLYRPMFPMGSNAPIDGNGWNPGLWIVDAATGAHRNIDIGAPSASLIDAAASPDGSRIIYSTTPGLGMGSDTFLMRSDGSNRVHLFSTGGGAQSVAGLFAWSPDGKRIAYERISDSSTPFLPSGLWVMDSQGGGQQRLADADGGHDYAPVWSPDSRKIAFVVRTNVNDQRADVQAEALQSAIGVVDIDSGSSRLVGLPAQTGVQMSINPLWTSDSASVTFTAMNPANKIVGGTPRYWSADVSQDRSSPQPVPLTPAISHVVAEG
ncbi:MAG TPA: hypothetical protein VKY19_19390 [Ktedonosporobacter sp.]|nr:hypothetical protein [Ktedonosporobacter sp.]